jgi:hypothetical protein
MSMKPFLEHARACAVCRRFPRLPCAQGETLLREGAHRLTRQLIDDPRRAKA